jgi:hypothetical protein
VYSRPQKGDLVHLEVEEEITEMLTVAGPNLKKSEEDEQYLTVKGS